MNVFEIKTPEVKKNLNYIENGIKNYIKKTNYPKKLVLNNITTEIQKRKELEHKLKEKIDLIQNEVTKMNNTIEILKNENAAKINKLLTSFSSNLF